MTREEFIQMRDELKIIVKARDAEMAKRFVGLCRGLVWVCRGL